MDWRLEQRCVWSAAMRALRAVEVALGGGWPISGPDGGGEALLDGRLEGNCLENLRKLEATSILVNMDLGEE